MGKRRWERNWTTYIKAVFAVNTYLFAQAQGQRQWRFQDPLAPTSTAIVSTVSCGQEPHASGNPRQTLPNDGGKAQ